MRKPRLPLLFVVVTAVTAIVTGSLPVGLSSAATYPVPYTFAAGILAGSEPVGTPPPGADNWSCRPSATHPEPVVLVHGLLANQTDNWQTISPLLADAGYCVFALTYGTEPGESEFGGLEPMEQSAAVLAGFVTRVLAASGAAKVDIVGHSEGATMPDYYVRFLGGAGFVDHYVAISGVFGGTNLGGLGTLDREAAPFGLSPAASALYSAECQSCGEFLIGSAFVQKLNAGSGAAAAGVTYTDIATRNDELVEPYTSGFLQGPNVTNLTVQRQCPLDQSDHLAIVADPVAARDVLNALDPARAGPVPCTLVLPAVG